MSRAAVADLLRDPAALIVVKATLILLIAAIVAAAASALSGARRHLLWLVALSSCVWLVASSPVVPAILVHTRMLPSPNADVPAAVAPPGAHAAPARSSDEASARVPHVQSPRPSSPSIPLPGHPLILLWTVGSLMLLLRQLRGFVATVQLARRASIAVDADVGRAIRLGYSTSVRTPMTFGVVNPWILLPVEAQRWSSERRRAVLVHERAHIQRGDWLAQMIGQLACALFWFHPLAWLAFARLRAEAERAADDCVLRSGLSASVYATHLFELAREATETHQRLVAVGIVSRSDLEARFMAMFDAKRSRAGVTRRGRAITTSVALGLICPLASLRVAVRHEMAPSARRASEPNGPVADGMHDAPGVGRPAILAAVLVERQALDNTQPSSTVAEPASQTTAPRPDFSGTWRVDAGPSTGGFVNDSLTITQSADSVSLESRGHGEGVLTSNSVHNITFDGGWARGMAITGDRGISFTTRAAWAGDTLVLTSYALGNSPSGGIHDNLNIERLTLSRDGNTVIDAQVSIPDGRIPRDGPTIFVLRRIAR